jgi:hypothetical protein
MFKTNALDSVGNAYVDEDPGTSTPGTRIEADDQNIKQDELVNAIEGTGQTLDPSGTFTNNDQLFRAILKPAYIGTIDYNVGERVIGSDNKEYACGIANGPGSSVVSPVGDFSGTWLEPGLIKSSIVYTVGSGGNYSTLNAALQDLSRNAPIYLLSGLTVTLQLLAGYVMAEQILVKGLNLGFVTIIGVDAETSITHTSLTTAFEGSYPAFGVSCGGTLPFIAQLFRMSAGTVPGGNKHGVLAVGAGSNAEINPSAGVVDAGTYGLAVINGASVSAESASFSGAGSDGIFTSGSSNLHAPSITAIGAGGNGINVSDASRVNVSNANFSGATNDGVRASGASSINAQGADASNAGQRGVIATTGSNINAFGTDATLAGVFGYAVSDSGIIDASSPVGAPTYSQALNTWLASGWIGQ